MITSTQLWVLEGVNFDNKYENVVSFGSETAQRSHFLNSYNIIYNMLTRPIRINDGVGSIRVSKSIDLLDKADYMIIKNNENEYIYAFINSVQYVDPEISTINFSVDYWQTYQFKHEIKDAFIEREHQDRFKRVNNKLIPIYSLTKENLELGEDYETIDKKTFYDNNLIGSKEITKNIGWFYILFTELPSIIEQAYSPIMLTKNNIPTGSYIAVIPFDIREVDTEDDLATFIIRDNVNGPNYVLPKSSVIKTIMKSPDTLSIYVSRYSPIVASCTYNSSTNTYTLDYSERFTPAQTLFLENKSFLLVEKYLNDIYYDFNVNNLKNNYTTPSFSNPKNIELEPKLKTKPYSLITFASNDGSSVDYDEKMLPDSIRYIETHSYLYKSYIGVNKNDDGYFYSNEMTKNNELPLLTDKYLEYLSNNKASSTVGIGIDVVQGLAGAGLMTAGLVTGVSPATYIGASLTLNAFQKVSNTLVRESDLKQAPTDVREKGNNFVAGMRNNFNNNEFSFLKVYKRQVKDVFYKRAFEYFYRYGYSVNNFGVPNLKSRYWFNFIKTTHIEISGNFNINTKNKIEDIYNKGVTIWHKRGSTLNMYDYTKENKEVSL